MKIPLFFDGYDLKAYDFPGGRPLSHLRERLRYHYRLMKGAQPSTGFYVAFSNLAKSLEMLGHEICINDFGFARRNPDYPVGFSGYLAPLARSACRTRSSMVLAACLIQTIWPRSDNA